MSFLLFPSQVVHPNSEPCVAAQSRHSLYWIARYILLHDKPAKTTITPKHKSDVRIRWRDPCKGPRKGLCDWWFRLMLSDMPLDQREFSNGNTKVKTMFFLSTGCCCWRSLERRTQTENLFNHLLWRHQNLWWEDGGKWKSHTAIWHWVHWQMSRYKPRLSGQEYQTSINTHKAADKPDHLWSSVKRQASSVTRPQR